MKQKRPNSKGLKRQNIDELLMQSPSFRASIRAARRDIAAGKGIPLAEVRRRLKA